MASSKDGLFLSESYIFEMQKNRLEMFKSQDLENGHFDVIFEIGEKKLHAHKFFISAVSEPMNAKFSDIKNEIIKIENYSYESFYEFLCFVYSGACNVTNENVFEIVDIAETFGLPYLKEFCDPFLTKMTKLSLENIEEMTEFAQKYSLTKFIKAVGNFIVQYDYKILGANNFLNSKKSFVTFLSATLNGIEYGEGNLFEAVFKWAVQDKQKDSVGDENFNLQEAVMTELKTIIPQLNFYKMITSFLMDFVVENGFLLSSTDIAKAFLYKQDKWTVYNDRFKWAYQVAEKQALQKQKISFDNENFSLTDSMKADLAELFPRVKFYKVQKKFVMDNIVANGIITEEVANRYYDTRVELKTTHKLITGIFNDEHGIRWHFERAGSPCDNRQQVDNKCRFYNAKIPIPSTTSTVIKTDAVEWYLCLAKDEVLTVVHGSMIQESDYLIAEMSSPDNLPLKPYSYPRLTFSDM